VSSNVPAIVRDLRLIHITISFGGESDTEALKKVFSKAVDWIYYMPNCWLVLTTSDINRWYARLQPLLGDLDIMLIAEIKPEEISGWIGRWVIDWVEKSQDRISKSQQPS
jgi:hypothetical protein